MALRIKDLRKAKGLTQDQLAGKARLSRSQLSEIETESKPVNTRRLAAIAKALDVDVSDLFDGGDVESYRDELILIVSDLPPADRDALLTIARAMRRASGG